MKDKEIESIIKMVYILTLNKKKQNIINKESCRKAFKMILEKSGINKGHELIRYIQRIDNLRKFFTQDERLIMGISEGLSFINEFVFSEIAKNEFNRFKFIPNIQNSIMSEQEGIKDVKYYFNSTLTGHFSGIVCSIFVDNSILITAGEEKTIKIWDCNIFKPIMVLFGHQNCITDMCVSPDNFYLSSADCDGLVIIWCLKTYKKIYEIYAEGPVELLEFCGTYFEHNYNIKENILEESEDIIRTSDFLNSELSELESSKNSNIQKLDTSCNNELKQNELSRKEDILHVSSHLKENPGPKNTDISCNNESKQNGLSRTEDLLHVSSHSKENLGSKNTDIFCKNESKQNELSPLKILFPNSSEKAENKIKSSHSETQNSTVFTIKKLRADIKNTKNSKSKNINDLKDQYNHKDGYKLVLVLRNGIVMSVSFNSETTYTFSENKIIYDIGEDIPLRSICVSESSRMLVISGSWPFLLLFDTVNLNDNIYPLETEGYSIVAITSSKNYPKICASTNFNFLYEWTFKSYSDKNPFLKKRQDKSEFGNWSKRTITFTESSSIHANKLIYLSNDIIICGCSDNKIRILFDKIIEIKFRTLNILCPHPTFPFFIVSGIFEDEILATEEENVQNKISKNDKLEKAVSKSSYVKNNEHVGNKVSSKIPDFVQKNAIFLNKNQKHSDQALKSDPSYIYKSLFHRKAKIIKYEFSDATDVKKSLPVKRSFINNYRLRIYDYMGKKLFEEALPNKSSDCVCSPDGNVIIISDEMGKMHIISTIDFKKKYANIPTQQFFKKELEIIYQGESTRDEDLKDLYNLVGKGVENLNFSIEKGCFVDYDTEQESDRSYKFQKDKINERNLPLSHDNKNNQHVGNSQQHENDEKSTSTAHDNNKTGEQPVDVQQHENKFINIPKGCSFDIQKLKNFNTHRVIEDQALEHLKPFFMKFFEFKRKFFIIDKSDNENHETIEYESSSTTDVFSEISSEEVSKNEEIHKNKNVHFSLDDSMSYHGFSDETESFTSLNSQKGNRRSKTIKKGRNSGLNENLKKTNKKKNKNRFFRKKASRKTSSTNRKSVIDSTNSSYSDENQELDSKNHGKSPSPIKKKFLETDFSSEITNDASSFECPGILNSKLNSSIYTASRKSAQEMHNTVLRSTLLNQTESPGSNDGMRKSALTARMNYITTVETIKNDNDSKLSTKTDSIVYCKKVKIFGKEAIVKESKRHKGDEESKEDEQDKENGSSSEAESEVIKKEVKFVDRGNSNEDEVTQKKKKKNKNELNESEIFKNSIRKTSLLYSLIHKRSSEDDNERQIVNSRADLYMERKISQQDTPKPTRSSALKARSRLEKAVKSFYSKNQNNLEKDTFSVRKLPEFKLLKDLVTDEICSSQKKHKDQNYKNKEESSDHDIHDV